MFNIRYCYAGCRMRYACCRGGGIAFSLSCLFSGVGLVFLLPSCLITMNSKSACEFIERRLGEQIEGLNEALNHYGRGRKMFPKTWPKGGAGGFAPFDQIPEAPAITPPQVAQIQSIALSGAPPPVTSHQTSEAPSNANGEMTEILVTCPLDAVVGSTITVKGPTGSDVVVVIPKRHHGVFNALVPTGAPPPVISEVAS